MKRLILFFLLIVGTLGLTARTLSPEEALERLDEGKSFIKGGGSTRASSKLVYTGEVNSTPQFYVFNRQGSGFVILSAESESRPIIGYSDSPADPDNMPPAAKAWLDGIQEGIAAGAFNRSKPSSKYRQPVAPMITAMWDQNAPYNDLCPEISGQRCLTGCGATSTAQMMKYYKYPPSATGTSYYYIGQNSSKKISVDMSQFQFDWATMDDIYTESSSEKSKQAVANLMFAAGCGLHMEYGLDESGTATDRAIMLKNYFGYSDAAISTSSLYFTDSEWSARLYEELSLRRPIFYGSFRHWFLIDGYEDGFFHANFGWSGGWNGYFDLFYLQAAPDLPLQSGGEAAFNVFPSNQSQPLNSLKEIFLDYEFGIDDPVAFRTSTMKFTGRFYNNSGHDVEMAFGVKCIDKASGEAYYYRGVDDNVKSNSGRSSFKLKIPDLPVGEFTVTPVFFYKDSDEPHEIPTVKYTSASLNILSTQEYYEISKVGYDRSFECTGFEAPIPISKSTGIRLNASFYSNLEQTIAIFPVLLKPGTEDEVYWGDQAGYLLPAGQNTSIEYHCPLNNDLEPGTYDIRLRDMNNWVFVSDPVPVEVVADVPTTLDLLELTCETGETAPMDDISIKGKLKCSDGAYAQEPLFYLCKKEGNMLVPVAFFKSSLCVINAGETAEVTATCQYLDADPEQQYYVYWVWDDHMQQKSPHLTLSLYKPDHPEEPEDPDDPEDEDPNDDDPNQDNPDNPDEEDPNSVAPDPGEPIENQPGDANGDGYVNVTDVVLIIDYVLDNKPANFNKELADVNGDGYVNVTDVVMTIDIILKK